MQLHPPAGHIKVHIIAAVVPVQAEYAAAIVTGLNHVSHFLCGRGRKHIAYRASVQHALANISKEYRKMPASSGCHDSNLALFNRIIGEKYPLIPVQ